MRTRLDDTRDIDRKPFGLPTERHVQSNIAPLKEVGQNKSKKIHASLIVHAYKYRIEHPLKHCASSLFENYIFYTRAKTELSPFCVSSTVIDSNIYFKNLSL